MSRVLLVGKGTPDGGGIAVFLDSILGSDLTAAHDIHLLNLSRDAVPEGGRMTASNVVRTVQDVRAVWRAAVGRDIVHVHSAASPGPTLVRAAALAFAGRARGCRVIVHAHGGALTGWMRTPVRRWIARLALSPANRVVAVSTVVGRALGEIVARERLTLVENGVDPSAYGPPEPPHDPPRVLCAGVLTPRKGVLDLLRASAMLIERGIAHEVILAGGMPGEGPAGEAIVRHALHDARHVRLLGHQPREAMPALYRSADVFCLPSWWEGMPLSVLEAMASGLAVVATDVGDVCRAVIDGRTGILAPPRDPPALAAALERVLLDPALRRRLGEEARVHVEAEFGLARTTGALDSLYRELQR